MALSNCAKEMPKCDICGHNHVLGTQIAIFNVTIMAIGPNSQVEVNFDMVDFDMALNKPFS